MPAETDTTTAPETPEVEAPAAEAPEAEAPATPDEAPAAPQVAEPEAAPAEPVAPAAEPAPTEEAPAAPQAEPETASAADAPGVADTPLPTGSAPQPAEAAAPEAAAPEAATPEAATPDAAGAPAAPKAPAARSQRASRQADRRKQLEELSRSTAAELGREPDRKIVEQAVMAAGGPDAVREFLATPQESREGKPLGWRIACLREARRHDANGKAELGWVQLSAMPVRQIRNTLDRAVDADGKIMFRDEAPENPRGRGGGRGGQGGDRGGRGRRPRGDDERIAAEFMSGGVASFGGENAKRVNPFEALSGLLEDDKKD
jgi:hypothetical protein